MTVAQTRAARLITWTRDEGEPMGNLSHQVRIAGEAAAVAAEAEQFSTIQAGRSILFGITALGALLGVISSWLVARSIIGPLRRIALALQGLASGDQTVGIPETDRDDEIGGMARSAQVFKDNAIEIERMTVEQEIIQIGGANSAATRDESDRRQV